MVRGKIPRHDSFGLEKPPLEIAIAALPMIAEKERIRGKGRLPAQDDTGQRPGRTGHANLDAGRRGAETHRHAIRREPRILAVGRDQTAVVLLDQHTRRKRRQFDHHGKGRSGTGAGNRGPARHRRTDQERTGAELDGAVEEFTTGGAGYGVRHGRR
jgi:hypothetical protein